MKYIATGRVHPERACVRFDKVVWQHDDSMISVECGASQLLVVIEDPRVNDYRSAHGTAEHIAQTLLSVLGFVLGCGYKAEITQVVLEGDNLVVVGVGQEELKFDVPDELRNSMQLETVALVRKDLYLRFALLDYCNALVDATGCAFLCQRSVESLAKSISKADSGNTDWKPMHAALHTDKKTIDLHITDFAKPVRHGNWAEFKPMTNEQRVGALKLTKELITRYIVYVQTGQVILPE
jgi:hypothetical protein